MKVKKYYIIPSDYVVRPLLSLCRVKGELREHSQLLFHGTNIEKNNPHYAMYKIFIAVNKPNIEPHSLNIYGGQQYLKNVKGIEIYGWLLCYQKRWIRYSKSNRIIGESKDKAVEVQLFVKPTYRRNGIGTALIQEANRWLSRNYPKLKYHVCAMHDNVKFFEKQMIETSDWTLKHC